MSEDKYGLIAAVVLAPDHKRDFDDTVAQFERESLSCRAARRGLSRDSEDIAMIDMDWVRIALAWVAPSAPVLGPILVIAVGASPMAPDGRLGLPFCERLMARILARMESAGDVLAVIKRLACAPICPDLLDDTVEDLLAMQDILGHPAPLDKPEQTRCASLFAAYSATLGKHRSRDASRLFRGITQRNRRRLEPQDDLRQLRAALAPAVPVSAEATETADFWRYATGATLCLNVLPVGMLLMCYLIMHSNRLLDGKDDTTATANDSRPLRA